MSKKTYTQEELQAAFDLVKDEQDWRAPISCGFPASQKDVVTEAIIHFTATTPEFIDLGFKDGVPWLGVYADGYRNGPAGP